MGSLIKDASNLINMCGIIAYSGGVDPRKLAQNINILSHRGPDGSGYKSNGREGIAHTRLAIQDLSENGSQPMTDEINNVSIVFNGEIYNVDILRNDLKSSSYQFRGSSDTEVILKLYSKYKERLLEKLDGIFSFVIWDHKNNTFFIARDPLGVKPLYYYCENGKFICSSEIKAIIADNEVPRALNFEAITSHLVYLWSPNPQTMFTHILKLEPGSEVILPTFTIVSCCNAIIKAGLKPVLVDCDEDTFNMNINHELKNLLKNSIKRQLISDVPVGSFLSGGVDSSAIAALVKIVQPDLNLKTFSINLEGINNTEEGMSDDLPYAKYMAEYLGYDLNIINVNYSIISQIDKMIYHLDEPTADPAALNTMLISKIARENGIKVLLSGTGGDDIFSGYRRHTALMSEKYWKWLPNNILNQIPKVVKKIPNYNNSIRRIKKALEYTNLEENERINSYFYWLNPDLVNQLYSENSNKKLNKSKFSSLIPKDLNNFDKFHPLNKMLYMEMNNFLSDHNLNYTDKMGMAEGVEIRVPLLDMSIVKFSLNLPIGYKYNSSSKWILRESLKEIVPKKILNRKLKMISLMLSKKE